jgi:hypothetical protein
VGVGYLLEYAPLVSQTPELKPYWGRELELRLVIPYPDPHVIPLATAYGIRVDIYSPEWVLTYLRELGLY